MIVTMISDVPPHIACTRGAGVRARDRVFGPAAVTAGQLQAPVQDAVLTSAAQSLALAAPAAVSVPAFSARTALTRQASSTWTPVTKVASSNWVFWNAARGRPNAVRWVTEPTVQSSAARTDASAIIAIDSRPGGSRSTRCTRPPPSRPSRLRRRPPDAVEEHSRRVVRAGLVQLAAACEAGHAAFGRQQADAAPARA